MFLSARPILDNPTSSLAPKLTDGNTAFPGHMSSGIADLVVSVLVEAGAFLLRLNDSFTEAISASVKVGISLALFDLANVAGFEPSLLDPRGDVGLITLVGDLAPFLRFVDRVGDDGLLLSERPWTERLSDVYFRVLIAPVWSRVETMVAYLYGRIGLVSLFL